MHGAEETCVTGPQSSQVVNGTAPASETPPPINQAATTGVSIPKLQKSETPPPICSSTTGGSIAICPQQGTILNIMSRPGAVAAANPNGTPVTLPLQPGMQIVNMRSNQSIQMAAGRTLPPRMIVNQIPNVRPAQPGQLTLQTLQGLPPGTQGHLIVKTDNGQLQLVRVNTAPVTQGQLPPNGTPTTTSTMVVHQTLNNAYRFQQPQAQTVATLANTTTTQVVNSAGQAIVVPVSVAPSSCVSLVPSTSSASVSTTASTMPTAQTTPAVGTQTISAESAKTKCKNFLATLLRLASEQRAKVAQNVRNLIQGLIDGKVEPEAFTEELQKDLNSSPQPCLVPFLKKTLPYLRASLAKGELTIEGVRPPPLSAVVPVTGMTTVIPSMVGIVRPATPLRVVTPAPGGMLVHRPATVAPQRLQLQQVRVGGSKASGSSTTVLSAPSATSTGGSSSSTSKGSKQSSKEEKKKEKNTFNSYTSSGVPDDDINDVAAMGGVNLGEESQRILDSTGFVGTQIRSCKDEVFLAANPLLHRIRQIASEYDLEEPPKEVVTLVSHAVQERLKTIIAKLGVIAEHRLDLLKSEPRYEVLQDVKSQLKFLEDLDKLEKKRKDEQEREMLLRAAKSRSKSEDPEQAKLKAKAKEMQRVEMEEMRQRDANLTALKALQGPKKKPKLDQPNDEGSTYSGTFTQKQMPLRPRVKRVNIRDLMFLMEQEKDLNKSNLLYRTYLK